MVQDLPRPESQHKLREFLGLIHFYHPFLNHGAAILKPLNDLLAAPFRQSKELVWTDDALRVFMAGKEALANATLLSRPVLNAPTLKKLKLAQTRYRTFDRELLAIYLAFKHFRHVLEGRRFFMLTAHKPLIYHLLTALERHSPRQIRQLDFISQFMSDIRHIQGSTNQATNALSRVQVVSQSPTPAIDFEQIAIAQRDNSELSDLRSTANSLALRDISFPGSSTMLTSDIFTGTIQPVVPAKFRSSVFNNLHSLSHPDIRATQHLGTTRYVWLGINKDVQQWAKTCVMCQQSKTHRHITTPLSTFATPNGRFDRVQIDIVGPFKPSQCYSYILTCVDQYTRWPEAIPIPDIMAETVARAFTSCWITHFCVPSFVTIDRGHQLEWTYGMNSCICGVVSTFKRQHTIQVPTGWWNGSIVNSRPC